MFTKKRILKSDRKQKKYFILIISISLVLFLIALIIFLFIQFFSTRNIYLSPLAKNSFSQASVVEKKLESLNVNYKLVSVSPEGVIKISLESGGEVILSSKKDINAQVSSLQLILSRLTIEGKKIKVLDLRYNSPVITFN